MGIDGEEVACAADAAEGEAREWARRSKDLDARIDALLAERRSLSSELQEEFLQRSLRFNVEVDRLNHVGDAHGDQRLRRRSDS